MLVIMVLVVSMYVKRGTIKEKLWELGNTGRFWKGTEEEGSPPPRNPSILIMSLLTDVSHSLLQTQS